MYRVSLCPRSTASRLATPTVVWPSDISSRSANYDARDRAGVSARTSTKALDREGVRIYATAHCRDIRLRVLEISFGTKALRTVCEDRRKAERRYGRELAKALRVRLADLRAAPSLTDFPFEVEIPARSSVDPTCSIRLLSDSFIMLCANHSKNPVDEANAIDWARVSRVKIVQIQDDS